MLEGTPFLTKRGGVLLLVRYRLDTSTSALVHVSTSYIFVEFINKYNAVQNNLNFFFWR